MQILINWIELYYNLPILLVLGAGLSFLFEIPAPGKEDVEFDLLDIEKVVIGNPFYIQVEMANRVGSLRTVTLSLNANSFYYTGILAKKIRAERHIIRLKPYQSKIIGSISFSVLSDVWYFFYRGNTTCTHQS